jgi:hypothetical protein
VYIRSPPSSLVEVIFKPIFLPRVPLMKPRTLWACQAVAFMIAASVAPSGRFNRSRTFAALLASRALPALLPPLGAFLAALASSWAQRAPNVAQHGPSWRLSAAHSSPWLWRCRFLR